MAKIGCATVKNHVQAIQAYTGGSVYIITSILILIYTIINYTSWMELKKLIICN